MRIVCIVGIIYLDYISFARLEFLLKEGRKINLTYESYSLRILLVS